MLFVYAHLLLIKICSLAILVSADNPQHKYHCLVRLGGGGTHTDTLSLYNCSTHHRSDKIVSKKVIIIWILERAGCQAW